MKKENKHLLGTSLWTIGSIISPGLTLLFMWVVYIIAAQGNPETNIGIGYWVGFIIIIIPIGSLIYGYARKIHNPEIKTYLFPMISGIACTLIILVLMSASFSIKMPL